MEHIVKRYVILASAVLMLLFLGTNQAWSVFVHPLQVIHGYSAAQMQLIFNTGTFIFCTVIIFAGRLHDRLGPRPLVIASAVLVATAWTLAWGFGEEYVVLWFAIGVLAASGSAVGYVCPLATAVKWFPRRAGLVSGLTAAGFGGGPILLSSIAEAFMRNGWRPNQVFGFVAVTYAPIILLSGFMLVRPDAPRGTAEFANFRRRSLLRDRRFWSLWTGMFVGTFPFLIVMGNAKPLALDFGLTSSLAAIAITVLAIGNACGRIAWGAALDRFGPRQTMLTAQSVIIVALLVLMGLRENVMPAFFFASLFTIGFCYGSNFAIYPATVARLYGTQLMGSVYPFIMAAQALSSFGATTNGMLKDATGSNMPGLMLGTTVVLIGTIICHKLSKSLHHKNV